MKIFSRLLRIPSTYCYFLNSFLNVDCTKKVVIFPSVVQTIELFLYFAVCTFCSVCSVALFMYAIHKEKDRQRYLFFNRQKIDKEIRIGS